MEMHKQQEDEVSHSTSLPIYNTGTRYRSAHTLNHAGLV